MPQITYIHFLQGRVLACHYMLMPESCSAEENVEFGRIEKKQRERDRRGIWVRAKRVSKKSTVCNRPGFS